MSLLYFYHPMLCTCLMSIYIYIYLYINYVSFCVLLSVHVLSTHAAAVKTCHDQSHGVHLYASCHPKPAMTYIRA